MPHRSPSSPDSSAIRPDGRRTRARIARAAHRLLLVLTLLVGVAAAVGAADASAAVTYRGSNSASNSVGVGFCVPTSTTATVAVPSGTTNGDILIATVASIASGGDTAPSGWTLLGQSTAGGSQKVYGRVFATGDPTSYGFTASTGFVCGSATIVASIDAYTGVDTVEPTTTGASDTFSGTGTLVAPGDTAIEAGSMRISSVVGLRANTTLTTTSWAGITSATSRNVTANSNSLNVASAYEPVGPGLTAGRTATLTPSVTNGFAFTIVLRPKHAQKLGFSTQPVGGVAEATNLATQPVVAAQYADGGTDTDATATVTLSKASGPAGGVFSCSGGLTQTTVNGLASFSGCQITGSQAAGTYTIRATATGLTTGTSSSFTIVAGPAAKLVFTTQPTGNVAENVNLPTQPTVGLRDAYDNVVTADTGSVTLDIETGPASGAITGCASNPRNAVAGVATFSTCKITGTAAAGTYTLNARRSGLADGVSASFTIVAGAANKLAFVTDPGDAPEGSSLASQPAVAIQDSYGNRVTTNTSTVTLAKASGPAAGIVSCTGGLSRAAVAGIATFVGCQVTGTAAAGTYTLSASGSYTGTTSASFVISAAAAAKLVFTTQPVGGVREGVNLPAQPAVSVQDTYGNLVTTDASAVTLSIASGPGTGVVGCTANPASASSGIATFSGCAITGTKAAGTYTLRASGSGLTAATSGSFVIVVGPAAKVAFTQQPVGGVSEGVALSMQPSVAVTDAYGNTVTGDTSTISLAIASGPGAGILTCTGGLGKAATAGIVAFAGCRITGTAAAGTYTLEATDGALTPDTSDAFVINPGAAAAVVFTTQPVGGVAQATALPTQPVATIRDAYGNTVTSDTSTVTLSVASGPGAGILTCTGGSARAATAGVATFSGCQITGTAAAGTYTLRAAGGALTPDVSTSFTIVAGAATKLTFTTQPVGGVPEGTDLPTQPRVSVQDAFGNVVPDATTDVLLAIASGPGSGLLGCTANPRSAVAGVATFSGCQITGTAAAGTYAVVASGGGLSTTISATFTITVGAASKLAFTAQPVGGVAPDIVLPSQPQVEIRDAYENPLTSESRTVALTVGSGPGGTRACVANAVPAIAGRATFAGCRITGAPGDYTLEASAGALQPATSQTFAIIAGSLSLTASPYSFTPITLNGFDQVATATLPLRIADTTGSAAGWRLSVSASSWSGGSRGTIPNPQQVLAPPAPSCDAGGGTCDPANPGSVAWPLALTSTPTVVYRAASGSGMGPQTIGVPVRVPIPGNMTGVGTFTQEVTTTIAAGP